MKLYKYSGTIEELAVERGRIRLHRREVHRMAAHLQAQRWLVRISLCWNRCLKEEEKMTDEKIIARMQADQEQGWPLCPRCGERMPDKLTHGALSRHAKGVYICEACGTDEALRDWTGNVKPLSDWVLVRVYNGDLRR